MKEAGVTTHSILYVDEEVKNLQAFSRYFSEIYKVYVATNLSTGEHILSEHEVKVLVINLTKKVLPYTSLLKEIMVRFPTLVVTMLVNDEQRKRISLNPELKNRLFFELKKPWNKNLFQTVLECSCGLSIALYQNQNLAHELRNAKEKILENDRLKSAFLANLSHEIRTPLNGILGFSYLVEQYATDNMKIKEYNTIIEQQSEKLLTVMNDIIISSKLHTGDIKHFSIDFNLVQLFESIYFNYKPILEEKNLNFKIAGIEKWQKIIVNTDRPKLNEVFNYLINNAIKFTPSGCIEIGFIFNKECLFYVKDSGIGIPTDKQKEIFKSFVQVSSEPANRDYGGNGLGLSIVKGLIEVVQGKIWLESELGKGSAFYFKFPLKIISMEEKQKVKTPGR